MNVMNEVVLNEIINGPVAYLCKYLCMYLCIVFCVCFQYVNILYGCDILGK